MGFICANAHERTRHVVKMTSITPMSLYIAIHRAVLQKYEFVQYVGLFCGNIELGTGFVCANTLHHAHVKMISITPISRPALAGENVGEVHGVLLRKSRALLPKGRALLQKYRALLGNTVEYIPKGTSRGKYDFHDAIVTARPCKKNGENACNNCVGFFCGNAEPLCGKVQFKCRNIGLFL